MKLLVLNGPNLNLLGLREPAIYGREDYKMLCKRIRDHAAARGVEVEIFQSNHEGVLVDMIQGTLENGFDGIVFNPAAYTHTSIALLDALKAVGVPTVEVHLSKVEEREGFRRISYVRAACIATVSGRGQAGYLDAIDLLLSHLAGK